MIKDLAQEVQGTTMGDTERSGGERSEAPRSGGSSTVERVSSGSLLEMPDPEVVGGRHRFGRA